MRENTCCRPQWTTLYRPTRPPHCQGRDLECEGEGHARCRSRSVTYPERHTRCDCPRHHYFTLHHLPRPATLSSLCPTTCDVTSASPADFQLLPAVVDNVLDLPMSNMDFGDVINDVRHSQKRKRDVRDVIGNVNDSQRTNQ